MHAKAANSTFQTSNGDYGDYLTLKIDESGTITNWLDDANLSNFETNSVTRSIAGQKGYKMSSAGFIGRKVKVNGGFGVCNPTVKKWKDKTTQEQKRKSWHNKSVRKNCRDTRSIF